MLAERDGELIGYAMVAIKTSAETELDDTWVSARGWPTSRRCRSSPPRAAPASAPRCSTSSTPSSRPQGIDDVLIAAFVTNLDAIRLYERRGFRPASLYMIRLAARS